MTTLHLSKEEITAMVVDEGGNVTIELTDSAAAKISAEAIRRAGSASDRTAAERIREYAERPGIDDGQRTTLGAAVRIANGERL